MTSTENRLGGARSVPSRQIFGVFQGGRFAAIDPAPWVLSAVTAAWTVYLLAPSYYFVDDYLRLGEAARASLNWTYLSSSVFGHFVPLWRLTYFLIQRSVGFGYWPVIVFETVLQVATVVATYRLLVALMGRRRWIAPVVAVYPFMTAMAPTLFWLANALHVMTSLCATVWVLDGFVRWYRTRLARYLAYSVVAECVGILFYEKLILTAILLPMLLIILCLGGHSISNGLYRSGRQLLALWKTWLAYAIPLAIYFAYYFTHGYYNPSKRPPVATISDVTWHQWVNSMPVTLIAGPYRWAGVPGLRFADPTPNTTHIAVGVLIFLVIASFMVNRRAWVGWAFAGVEFLASFLVVALGRIEYLVGGPVDYRYTGDTLMFLIIGGCLAFGGTAAAPDQTALGVHYRATRAEGTQEGSKLRALLEANERSLYATLCLGAGLFAGISGWQFSSYAQGWYHGVQKGYWTTFMRDVHVLNSEKRPFSVFDGQPPLAVALSNPYDISLLSWNAHTFAPNLSFDDLTKPMYMVQPNGSLVRAEFHPLSTVPGRLLSSTTGTVGPQSSLCLGPGTSMVTDPLSGLPNGGMISLEISYTTTADATVQPTEQTAEGLQFATRQPSHTVALLTQRTKALATIESQPGFRLNLAISTPGRTCINAVEVGVPVPISS